MCAALAVLYRGSACRLLHATVFESYIEYPTDAKLLWRACFDVYQMIKEKRIELKLLHTRINHEKSGKEVKQVEFGDKVHMLLVNGISFIEHLSYDNFKEGTRMKHAIYLQQRYFGACHQMGADAIYATNKNRRYCTQKKIATCFAPKSNEGKLKEEKSQKRSLLGKVRSTVMEGSFGNEKNHYQLGKIKAKTEANEKVWIIFSLLACNANQISKRMQAAKNQKQAA